MRLEKVLAACGFSGDAQTFRQAVLEEFESLFPGQTDENILYHPSTKALVLCEAVRKHFGIQFPEDLILRTLINMRKASQRPKTQKASAQPQAA